ncbi:hypothetical protein LINPERPRIM_LOCUS2335 [Linum perenne]
MDVTNLSTASPSPLDTLHSLLIIPNHHPSSSTPWKHESKKKTPWIKDS